MKPLVNNPAWVRAIQDVVDALPSEPADQINADPGTTAFQQFLTGTGSLLEWWGDIGTVGEDQRHRDDRRCARLRHPAGVGRRLQFPQGCSGRSSPSGPNIAPNMAYLGWGIYVMKGSTAIRSATRRPGAPRPISAAKDLSMWTAAYPSGFQPYRKSHTNLDLWALAGYDKKYIGSYMNSQSTSYNHPNSAIEPRIPGIFQYYSVAEDELQKSVRRQGDRATGRRQRRRGLG